MKATPLFSLLLILLVAGCSNIVIEGQFLQPADATATALATSIQVVPTSPPDLGATAAIERAVRLTLTAAVPSPTNTLPPSPTNTPPPSATAVSATAIPPTETPVPTATKKPAPLPTFTSAPMLEPFTGTWVGTDTVDGSITTLVLVQTENTLRGTFSDTYSPNVQPPGYQGSGSGVVLSDTTAQMTFNLSRWDGKTAESKTLLTLSNQNNTLTLTFDSCSGGCPIVLQRQ